MKDRGYALKLTCEETVVSDRLNEYTWTANLCM